MHWYPLLLAGQAFSGIFAFTNTTTLIWHQLKQLGPATGDAAVVHTAWLDELKEK